MKNSSNKKATNTIIVVGLIMIATILAWGIVSIKSSNANKLLEKLQAQVIVEQAMMSEQKESKDKINKGEATYQDRLREEEACFEDLCFVKGTKVITPRGLINIEELKKEEEVYTRNEKTNEIEIKKILQIFESNYENDILKIYTKDSSIEATLKHKFYIKNNSWTKAENLKVGDILVNNSNEELEIKKIERIESTGIIKVYNLEVEDNHNYFVGFDCVLVHNCCVDENSLILIDNLGSTKSIKSIREGDMVLTYNSETKINELKPVTRITIKEKTTDIVTITFEDGTQIIQNMYHEMYTRDGWKSLTNFYGEETLSEKDFVKTEDGWKKIEKIEINLNHEPLDLYTIDTKENNNFYANGTLMKGY